MAAAGRTYLFLTVSVLIITITRDGVLIVAAHNIQWGKRKPNTEKDPQMRMKGGGGVFILVAEIIEH